MEKEIMERASGILLPVSSLPSAYGIGCFSKDAYEFVDRLAEADVKNVSLTDFDAVVDTAAKEGYIKTEDRERLIKFRNNPSDESCING